MAKRRAWGLGRGFAIIVSPLSANCICGIACIGEPRAQNGSCGLARDFADFAACSAIFWLGRKPSAGLLC